MKQIPYALLLGPVIFLTGCMDSLPTEADARQVFSNSLTQEFLRDGTLVITKFIKVNGKEGELMGNKIYQLYYEAELYYPNGLNRVCLNLRPSYDYASQRAKCRRVTVRDAGAIDIKKSSISFSKTEKGWRASDGNVY